MKFNRALIIAILLIICLPFIAAENLTNESLDTLGNLTGEPEPMKELSTISLFLILFIMVAILVMIWKLIKTVIKVGFFVAIILLFIWILKRMMF